MKLNKYTIKIKHNEGYILYNLISKTFLIVEDSFFINGGNTIDEDIDENQLEYLKEHFIISENNSNDYEELVKIAYDFNTQDEVGRFMIHLGYRCNLSCSYCYQSNIKDHKDNNVKDIIKVVSNIIQNQEFSDLDICFIGGEPLMYLEDILKISRFISSNNTNKRIYYSLVTNGTLLNQASIINQLKDHDIKNFQITIDGLKEDHDNFRNNKSGGSFERIIENLKYIQKYHSDVNILLNCNISKYNYKNVHKIIDFLEVNNINYPVFFSLIFDSNDDQNNSIQYTGDIWYQVHKYAIQRGNDYLPFYRDMYLGCAMTQSNYYIINPEGEIYSCINAIENDNYLISDKSSDVEPLQEKKINNFNEKINSLSFECKNCEILPICFGGCDYQNTINGFKCNKDFILKNEVGIIKEIANARGM